MDAILAGSAWHDESPLTILRNSEELPLFHPMRIDTLGEFAGNVRLSSLYSSRFT